MGYIRQPIIDNPLATKQDLQEAFRQLTRPLKELYSAGSARLQIRGGGAGHPDEVADMEGFSRVLWGLVPYLAGGGQDDGLWELCLKGIVNGTDPSHPEYWGDAADYDQRLVEMAVLGLALCLIPDRIWTPLQEREQANLYNWLNQINKHPCYDCNWLFFNVLVNMGFFKAGLPHDQEQMEANLKRLEEFDLGEGWYSDGIGGHSDYYVPFAIQFYGLVYAKLMDKEDPERCAHFRERGILFAEQFLHWFSPDGSALPYGRSLTYRFAQSAFWSALAFSGAWSDNLGPGVAKGLVMRNLRWWFKQPIFDREGVLTVGYAYPNLVMAENYNAPGSPYWALKTFLVLALADDHPFWSVAEEVMPVLPALSVQSKPHLVICRDEATEHVAAFNSGHGSSNEHTHTSAKYEKFVYSTAFGFSVPRAEWGLAQGAFDSMLALCERDNLFRVRRKNEETRISGNVLYARWLPWYDVEVQTWIVAGLPWHVRIHLIRTQRGLNAAEGGFALGRRKVEKVSASGCGLEAANELGASGVFGLLGYSAARAIYPNANTNLLYPRTVIPTLEAVLEPGTHLLASAVYGRPGMPSEASLEEGLSKLGVAVTQEGVTLRLEGGAFKISAAGSFG